MEDFESFFFLAVFRNKLLYRDDQFDQSKQSFEKKQNDFKQDLHQSFTGRCRGFWFYFFPVFSSLLRVWVIGGVKLGSVKNQRTTILGMVNVYLKVRKAIQKTSLVSELSW